MSEDYTNSDMANRINERVHSIVDRRILRDRFLNTLTYAEISAKEHVSVSTVSRVIRKYKPRLFLR